MPKIKYTNEFKLMIINLSKIEKDWWKIAKEYNITSGPALIRHWNIRYNNIKELEINKMTKEQEYLLIIEKLQQEKLDIKKKYEEKLANIKINVKLEKEKNHILNKEITIEKKKNKKIQKEKDLKQIKVDFLEKSIPSFLNQEMKEWMEMKIFKNMIFNEIWMLTHLKTNSFGTNELCKLFRISKSNYISRKKEIDKLINKKLIYKPKWHVRTEELVDNFYKTHGNIACGAQRIRKWILIAYNIKISCETIRKMQKLKPNDRPVKVRTKKIGGGSYSLSNNVRPDLIKNDFESLDYGQKIGMDGTWFKNIYIKSEKTKIFCEFAFDWYSRELIAYTLGDTENTDVVLENLVKVYKYLKNNNYKNSIVQMDRGAANCSNEVKTFETIQNKEVNFTISMSNAGFKHNAPTESLNGWFKDQFLESYGTKFICLQDFKNKFKDFVCFKNKIQKIQYSF